MTGHSKTEQVYCIYRDHINHKVMRHIYIVQRIISQKEGLVISDHKSFFQLVMYYLTGRSLFFPGFLSSNTVYLGRKDIWIIDSV